VVAKQAKVEITIATATWKEQQKKLEKFLLTVCEPRLAWLPGKPSVVTESMISNRAEEVADLPLTFLSHLISLGGGGNSEARG
jgi:hypothetical protein